MKYKPQRVPDENQVEALSVMRGKEFFALLMDMRTRKTKVVLDDFGELELKGLASDLLVIAPGGVFRTWEGAANLDLSLDLLSRAMVLVWSSSKPPKTLKYFLEEFEGPRVMIMNVEALSIDGKGRKAALEFLSRRSDRTYVAIDESTCIKNKAKRTKFVMDRVKPLSQYRRILSGLATPRSLLDLFWQFYFLDWKILGIKNAFMFKHYAANLQKNFWGGRWVEVIDKTKGINGFKPEVVDEVQRKIKPHSFRVEFKPKIPPTFEIREIEMTPEQKQAYSEMKQFATTALASGGHVTATVVIAQIVRMHQILLGHVVDDETGVEHSIPENRTEELINILNEYSCKSIIWCSYDFNVRAVSKAIEEEFGGPVARFWGGNLKTREAEELRFRTDPKCRFMVATPDAGGKGRTWDMADLAVYYSNRDNLELRNQAEMRTMGKDKDRCVENIDLVVRGTVDEKILHALRNKIDMATTINGDDWREWVV